MNDYLFRVTYSAMMIHRKAYPCHRKASELDPGNENYVNNVLVTQNILALENENGENQSPGRPEIIVSKTLKKMYVPHFSKMQLESNINTFIL